MRIYLHNDTSSWHAGSRAVMNVLRRKLESGGHEIAHVTPRPEPPVPEWIETCDALVVNGEGTLQEEPRGWYDWRARRILESLSLAKSLGKKAYLVNTVWYRMCPGWGPLLKSLDGLSVREVSSRDEMVSGQAVEPALFLDLSYAHPVAEGGASDLAGRAVVGSFYRRYMTRGDEFDHMHGAFAGIPRLHLGGVAEQQHDLEAPLPAMPEWPDLVRRLRGASLYITGQQHGVYLACRARVPFAVFRTHNHKTEGLFRTAGMEFPIAATRADLERNMAWALRHPECFEALFDWMEKQPVWPGID